MNTKEIFAKALAHATGKDIDIVRKSISLTKDIEHGILSSNIAFVLSKELKKSPQAIAEELSSFITLEGIEGKLTAINGYINLSISDEQLFSIDEIPKKDMSAIVEGPSVNPNKPWHLGHLRNALLCMSIGNILREAGYSVIAMDYVNDLGLQVAQSYWHYKKSFKDSGEKFDHAIGKDYVKAAELFNDKEVEEEVRKLMKDIEAGNDKGLRDFVELVYKAQRETAYSYGITHTYAVFESDVVEGILKKGLEKLSTMEGIYKADRGDYKGCYVVNVEDVISGLERPERVLIRSDGIPTYLGKDIVFHMWKIGKLCCLGFHNFEMQPNNKPLLATPGELPYNVAEKPLVINIIGAEQNLPQQVVKSILIKLSLVEPSQYRHVSYGRVRKEGGTFSGRKGTWMGFTADELLKEGMARVEKGDKEKIALAAIKFSFLRASTRKEIVFDWDKALSLEGASGVYLLYSLVRAKRILSKVSTEPLPSSNLNKEEKELMAHIWRYPYYVENAATSLEPNTITEYLLKLSTLFNKFYEKHRVIGEEEEAKRVAIVSSFIKAMEKGLSLLGIEPVEEM
ncbi:MAG: arginine--tRNA ligase [Methanobacteriota archaeon]|nr:MAG: arginine--tRNA ligase [Euryarchaeota archaeon]